MPLTDEQLLDKLRENRPAFAALLGAEFQSLDSAAGEARINFMATKELCNPMGGVQGGFVSAMLDYAMTMAGFAGAREFVGIPTLEMKTSFLEPVRPGPHRGLGRVVRMGRTIMFLEGWLHDGEDKLVATATATAMVIPPEKKPG